MRLYGKRFIRKRMAKTAAGQRETMNAVLIQVDELQRKCLVKIQNSSEYITAWFPQNFTTRPEWMRINNAVTLRHTGGKNIGRLEIIGHGELIPSTYVPIDGTQDDAVLTGMVPIASGLDMSVSIGPGTYRLNGVEYAFGGGELTMEVDSNVTMGANYLMGEAGAVVVFTAPAAGYFRYDIVVIGADGVVDVVQGTPATTSPVMPTTPANHLKLFHVLLYGGMTAIKQEDINRTWWSREPASLVITVTKLMFGGLPLMPEEWYILVEALDQYGARISMPSPYWYFQVEQIEGLGMLHSDQEGDSDDTVGYRCTVNDPYNQFWTGNVTFGAPPGFSHITFTPEIAQDLAALKCTAIWGDYTLESMWNQAEGAIITP